MAYSNVYFKGGGEEIVPNIIGSSTNEVISEEVDNANIKACLLENADEEVIVIRRVCGQTLDRIRVRTDIGQ